LTTGLQINPLPDGIDQPPATRVVFGDAAAGRLGELAIELGAGRVLVVSDPGVAKAGHLERCVAVLRGVGLVVGVFDAVHENPTTDDVDACLTAARDVEPDLFVGLGGGSSLDTAKGCNFLLTNGGRMEDYLGFGKASKPLRPMIACPTTAGTGSEVQSYALIASADEHNHRKMACGDATALPRVAVLDPALTLTQPARITATAGLDAFVHAVEAFVCTKRNPASSAYAKAAYDRAKAALPRVLADGRDREARAGMLLAACWAGLAIEHSMLGAAHAAANPLTARFGITHGHAVALLLPHAVRHNAVDPAVAPLYDPLGGPYQVAHLSARLLQQAGLPPALSACGIPGDDATLDELAADAETQWTGRHNPRPIDAAGFRELYTAAL